MSPAAVGALLVAYVVAALTAGAVAIALKGRRVKCVGGSAPVTDLPRPVRGQM